MRTHLYNARLVLPNGIRNGSLVISDGKIESVSFSENVSGEFDVKTDCGGNYIAPGFIEIHTHGAGGADFMDGTLEAFEAALTTHLYHGTTTILPTAVAASNEEIKRSIDAFRLAKEKLEGKVPHMLGLHMEGPYLCARQCGAIDPKYIRDPKSEEYEMLLEYGKGAISRWTLAVERDGAEAFARRLRENGILPSVGHSDAEYSQVKRAFDAGVTHVTHLYSATSTIVRRGGFRFPGVTESAFIIPDMTVELIADGCHLPPELINMVYRLKGADRTVLTCDSMRCAGQDVTESVLGSRENGQRVIIEDDVAKMPDRTAFAGSIALDDRLIRTAVFKADIPLADAVRMITLTPAEILGIDNYTGSLEAGKDADIVMFDENINILGVMVSGNGLAGELK
ncbi:MAG: N-acetylglucosamine-6-phosphate deacetylase [Eubacteriales bacterium]|nr:N-acetylglucosamine-6-phosphate deacetylase [Eubacteriales bacterium]